MNTAKRIMPWLLSLVAALAVAVQLQATPISLVGSGSVVFGGTPTTAGTTFSTAPGAITASSAAGSSTITYSALPNEITVALNPGDPASFITLGVFNSTSSVPTGTPVGSRPNFSGGTVTLSVSFSTPSDVGPQSFNGIISGTIVQTASGAYVQWATGSLTFVSPTVGTFVVTLIDTPFTPINAPSSPDASRIRGTIQLLSGPISAIPEPGTLMLLGSGLFGLTAVARRGRRRKKTE